MRRIAKLVVVLGVAVLASGCAAPVGPPDDTPAPPAEVLASEPAGHNLSDEQFWDLGDDVFHTALVQEIPVSEVSMGPERWQIQIVIRAERSDALEEAVNTHLVPAASQWDSEVTVTYDPDAEHVTFEGKPTAED